VEDRRTRAWERGSWPYRAHIAGNDHMRVHVYVATRCAVHEGAETATGGVTPTRRGSGRVIKLLHQMPVSSYIMGQPVGQIDVPR
jgi:hypothetical protein